MTKAFSFAILILAPALAAATPTSIIEMSKPSGIPSQFLTSGETRTLEWGCPVSDRVHARNRAEAMGKIRAECLEEARRAANEKPDVVNVIRTSVIYPDIDVTEEGNEYVLSGTFFLETLVLQRGSGGE